ncbi:MAG: hypothetical protein L0206_17340 [Actinobacteria bacterium]|nr:hypothetical protein [Actinomycetota bacterium]
MPTDPSKFAVYLEIGTKRIFAGAVDWPGWARSGRDEASALEALLAYAPRYAQVVGRSRLGFELPSSASAVRVVERLTGNATTDFGAPDVPTSTDGEPIDAVEHERLEKILKACWRAFDKAVEAAEGRELRKGPRGGGRSVEKIVDHVVEAEGAGYLSRIGWKVPKGPEAERISRERTTVLKALETVARDGVPPDPRGGRRWPPRYFVRRSAWHVLDHAWEIEDRIE